MASGVQRSAFFSLGFGLAGFLLSPLFSTFTSDLPATSQIRQFYIDFYAETGYGALLLVTTLSTASLITGIWHFRTYHGQSLAAAVGLAFGILVLLSTAMFVTYALVNYWSYFRP